MNRCWRFTSLRKSDHRRNIYKKKQHKQKTNSRELFKKLWNRKNIQTFIKQAIWCSLWWKRNLKNNIFIRRQTYHYSTNAQLATSFLIAEDVRGTESAIISSYPTSVSGIIVLLNTKHLTLFIYTIDCFKSWVSRSVSIFEQTTGYWVDITNKEPIRLPEIQYPVFGIS